MTDYTRLTIVGSTRRADVVVPSDDAVGSLVPRLMELLDEAPGAVSRPLALVRVTGEQLDSSLSAAEQRLLDGERLRLLREDAAPPPPEVADVTDVLAESLGSRPGLWTDRTRAATAAVVVGALSLLLAATLLRVDELDPLLVTGPSVAVAVGVAVLAGRLGGRWIATAATAVALGACVPAAVVVVAALGLDGAVPTADLLLVASALVQAVLALGVGVGLRLRAAAWGGLLGVVLSVVPVALRLLDVDAGGALGVGAVLAVVVCGLLPWYAMSASGLTGLDDQVLEGRRGRRDDVLLTVTDAYRTLTWATVAVAAPLAVTSAHLLASSDLWQVGLGVAVVVVVAARTRTLPLAVQGAALWAAVLLALVGGLVGQALAPLWLLVLLPAVGVVVALVAGGVHPVAHQRASLRRFGNTVEAFGVVALLPVLLGVFGVYEDLLGAFS